MNLLLKLDQLKQLKPQHELGVVKEHVLTHGLHADLAKLAYFPSTARLEKSPLYAVLAPEILKVTNGSEHGCFADPVRAPNKAYTRAVVWDLDHGINFAGIRHVLRNHAYVSSADIYLFPSVDIGLSRSHNLNVVRDLAIELGYNYVFASTFLHLNTPATDDTQALGVEGIAIMTRFPVSAFRIIPLSNVSDPLKSPSKRLGCEKALAVDVEVNGKKLTLVCLNLPQNSTPWQRSRWVRLVMGQLCVGGIGPTLIGANLNTSCYITTGPWGFFFSVFNKVFRGFTYIREEHHTHPEKYFERGVFAALKANGFDYQAFNETGQGTFHVRPIDLIDRRFDKTLASMPAQKILRSQNTEMSFKTTWFAAGDGITVSASNHAEKPRVIPHLFHDGIPLSPHDPALLDFEVRDKFVVTTA